jgi:signal transduction histidine kinase
MHLRAARPYPGDMRVPTMVTPVLARIERVSEEHGLAYPWWIPIASWSGQLGAALAALAQRDEIASGWTVLVVALLVTPAAIQLLSGRWISWWLEALLALGAVGVILSLPQDGLGAADLAPFVLCLIAAESTAREGYRRGLVVTGAAVAMVLVAWSAGHVGAIAVNLLVVILGADIGYMFHWQARALAAEREARASEHTRATLAERDRIAREIHDLVAHSLSVTMLQITGARRMLTDGDDVVEAIDALRDAERVGRQAMHDIRQTVSDMATEGDQTRPLPGADDLPSLVQRVRNAGLDAGYQVHGDIGRLPPALGLGLYRVVQESLTNVTKHAPGAAAHVSVAVGRSDVRLTVRSTRTDHTEPDGTGSGITGMEARIAQLGGQLSSRAVGEEWVVEAVVPLDADEKNPHCVVSKIQSMTAPTEQPAT